MVKVAIEEVQSMIGALLEQAEHGEQIVITRNGAAVAKIISSESEPVLTEEQYAEACAASERMRERARSLKLSFDWEELKADRDFGRR